MKKNNKKILIVLSLVLVICVALFALGIAYAGGVRGVGLLGVWFFATFAIVVVLAQAIPAGILFATMIGTIFSGTRKSEAPVTAA